MEDRSVGTLLGVACGDILGAPVKGFEGTVIAGSHGRVSEFLDGEGKYTDDTQLTLALADSLVEHKQISFLSLRLVLFEYVILSSSFLFFHFCV